MIGPVPRNLLLVWAVTVAAIWLIAAWVGARTSASREVPSHPRSVVNVLSTFDGFHYGHIAELGYSTAGEETRRFAFFPLLPLLSRLLGGADHAPLAGILLSQIFLLGSMVLLGLIEHDGQPATLIAQPGFWLVVSPLGFFLSVYYAESLFLFLSLAMFLLFRRQRFLPAALAGFLAGLTRPGVLALPALLLPDALERLRVRSRWPGAVAVAISPFLGLACWLGVVAWKNHDLLAYVHIQARWWEHRWALPFAQLALDFASAVSTHLHGGLLSHDQYARLFSAAGVIALTVWGWRGLEKGLLAYLIAGMIFIHSQEPHTRTPRYELVLFPAFLLLARFASSRPRLAPVLAGMLGVMQFLLFLDHASWRWVS